MSKFIHIKSDKFKALPGEKDELVNDGTYGKALAAYLQTRLSQRGYNAPRICCEDWGWWVELKNAPFAFGVCIYSGPLEEGPVHFACTDGASGRRKWSWSMFRFIDTSPWTEKLFEDMMTIFQRDDAVKIISVSEEFPDLGGSEHAD